MIRPLLLAALLAGCGARPPAAPPAPRTAPLVDAWRPERPLVEVTLNGHGPYLFVLATGLPATTVVAPVARDVGLRVRPDRDPRHGRADHLRAGALELRDVRCRIVDPAEAFGTFLERPVVGALGADVLGAFEVDPGAGLVRFAPAAPPPPDALQVPLDARGGGHTVPATVGGEDVDLWLATESPLSRLRPGLEAERGPIPHHDVTFAGQAPRRVLVLPLGGAPGGVDGVLGGDLLRGFALRVDPDAGRLHLWTPHDDVAARLARFPDVGLAGLRAQLIEATPGRVEVAFAPPDRPLPPRYWVRVDAGRPGDPRPLLVRLQPRVPGPLRAAVEHRDLDPERLRPPGAPLDIVDVVPLDTPCQGDVCLVY